ncbi:DUF6419 family natural product biosynthesis protein [Pseudoalteromonas rubra]|uniref:Uncharacterized protein n=1 Tax=Pseudoalteromonas rubra TaxID=43658 RepID=A0A0F4QGN4_9GAMM|nr:hypothetical protein TW77_21355 [Pseudoalteromonas rubra]
MQYGTLCVASATFFAMLLSAHLYQPAVFLNLVSCVLCAIYGYQGASIIAMFLAWCNVQAFLVSPWINLTEQPSIKMLVIFLLCVMFAAISIGVHKR